MRTEGPRGVHIQGLRRVHRGTQCGEGKGREMEEVNAEGVNRLTFAYGCYKPTLLMRFKAMAKEEERRKAEEIRRRWLGKCSKGKREGGRPGSRGRVVKKTGDEGGSRSRAGEMGAKGLDGGGQASRSRCEWGTRGSEARETRKDGNGGGSGVMKTRIMADAKTRAQGGVAKRSGQRMSAAQGKVERVGLHFNRASQSTPIYVLRTGHRASASAHSR